jgi:hypothetical protein
MLFACGDRPRSIHVVVAANIERSRTAHLDAFGMAKGAVLMLPKP